MITVEELYEFENKCDICGFVLEKIKLYLLQNYKITEGQVKRLVDIIYDRGHSYHNYVDEMLSVVEILDIIMEEE